MPQYNINFTHLKKPKAQDLSDNLFSQFEILILDVVGPIDSKASLCSGTSKDGGCCWLVFVSVLNLYHLLTTLFVV